MPCPSDQELRELRELSLSASRADEVRAHVEGCPSCAASIHRASNEEPTAGTEPGSGGGHQTVATVAQGPEAARRAAESVRPALARGSSIGRYVVVDPLGEGGMGVVYAAYDPELNRKVAIKLLQPDQRASGTEKATLARARLLREAQALARLAHPNVIAVYDVGSFEDQVFVAMELVEGQNLRDWMTSQPRHWREVALHYAAAGRGLQAAHEAGLIHRDFKPDNVLLGTDGRVRVLDFGLARATDAQPTDSGGIPVGGVSDDPAQSGPHSSGALSEKLTRAGLVMGTPAYMAPEQVTDASADARTDQFSFGVSLYEALYGFRPFKGPPKRDDLARWTPKEPPKDAQVPSWLRKIVFRTLSLDPGERYPSMRELIAELERDVTLQRRRWAMGAAVVLLVGALGGTYAVVEQRRSQVCRGGERKLAGVWDATRKAEIEAAFSAAKLSYSADVAASVARALDGYTSAWVVARQEACEATRVHGEQSTEVMELRLSCLDRRLADVQALTQLFTRADAQIVQKAAQATRELRSLGPCAEVSTLTAAVQPPEDPKVRTRVEELRSALPEVRALFAAGKQNDAAARIAPVAAAVRETGYAPAIAEISELHGRIQLKNGEPGPAAATFKEALFAAIAGRVDDGAASSAIGMVEVSDQLAKFDEGDDWSAHARASLRRIGGNTELEANLTMAEGNVWRSRGDYRKALASYQQALVLREQIYPADHPLIALSNSNVAAAQLELGEYDASRQSFLRALAVFEGALGPQHIDLTATLNNLGVIAMETGDYPGALAAYGRALEIRKAVLAPNHPRVLTLLMNIANVYSAQHRNQEAIAQHQQVLEEKLKSMGPDHPDTGLSIQNVADAHFVAGDYPRALEGYQRSRALFEKALGDSHEWVAEALDGIGGSKLALNQAAAALPLFERSLKIREQALGDKGVDVAKSLVGVGRAQIALNRANQALAPLERALQLRETGKTSPALLAEAHFQLARALWLSHGDQTRARRLADSAAALYSKAPAQRAEAARVTDWIAAHSP